MNCQIIHWSWLERGFADAYVLRVDDAPAGYALVGGVRPEPREKVVEFFVTPGHGAAADALFRALVAASGARSVEAQTNDAVLTSMVHECARAVEQTAVLFADGQRTHLHAPTGNAKFRGLLAPERASVFEHKAEPVGDWAIEDEGRIVATGGFLTHYNPPFADVHMEVAGPFRKRGYGGYLVQELRRVCREAGRVPAARCNVANDASRACLVKGGFAECGRMLRGTIDLGALR